MKITDVRNAIIPPLATFCGVPIIMADDTGDKPAGPHATYKITMPYAKGVGHPEETTLYTVDGIKIKRVSEYRATFSFTAYSMDEDESIELAQQIYDWFAFDGYEILDAIGVVIAEQTEVSNRDAFIVENYERRNGFDIIIKVMDEKTKDVDWFDRVRSITFKGGNY